MPRPNNTAAAAGGSSALDAVEPASPAAAAEEPLHPGAKAPPIALGVDAKANSEVEGASVNVAAKLSLPNNNEVAGSDGDILDATVDLSHQHGFARNVEHLRVQRTIKFVVCILF